MRREAYLRKIEVIEINARLLDEWLSDFSKFKESALLSKASYKAFQEIVEACTGIIAMKVKDCGKEVSDDYTNIEKLVEMRLIDKNIADALKEANGLRNLLVHGYNKIIDEVAYESMKRLLEKYWILLKLQENG